MGRKTYSLFRKQLSQLLDSVNPLESLGKDLFNSIWRLVPQVAIEVVCFQTVRGYDYVYLTRRESSEAYAGLLHSPGTIYRTADKNFNSAVIRLSDNEYSGPRCLKLLDPDPVNVFSVMATRGLLVSLGFLGQIVGDVPLENWHLVDSVLSMTDDEIVDHHRDLLIPATYKIWSESFKQ